MQLFFLWAFCTKLSFIFPFDSLTLEKHSLHSTDSESAPPSLELFLQTIEQIWSPRPPLLHHIVILSVINATILCKNSPLPSAHCWPLIHHRTHWSAPFWHKSSWTNWTKIGNTNLSVTFYSKNYGRSLWLNARLLLQFPAENWSGHIWGGFKQIAKVQSLHKNVKIW